MFISVKKTHDCTATTRCSDDRCSLRNAELKAVDDEAVNVRCLVDLHER